MATAVGPKRRLGHRSDGLETITTLLFQVRFSQTRHLRLDEKMILPMLLLNKQCNQKWQSYGWSKKFAQSAVLHSNDHDSTDSTNARIEDHWWDKHRKRAGVARSYMESYLVQVHAGESKLRSCVDVAQRRGGKAERRKLVIIYHATDIVCSFHCQNNRLLRS